jgi:hypothetical protein
MLNDFSKLLVMVILAVIAYNVMSGTDLIKNTGTLVTGGEGAAPVQVQAPAASAAAPSAPVVAPAAPAQNKDDLYKNNPNVLPYPQISNNFAAQGNFQPTANYSNLSCYPKDELNAADLLPKEGAFADSNPSPQGTLSNRNLFEAGHHAGLNTQLSSLRNANRQLRSDPLIPRVAVGPWSQSTYEADTNRREFEIGGI